MDTHSAVRSGLTGLVTTLLVGGAMVATDRASSQLAELAPARDIGLAEPAQSASPRDVDNPCERFAARTSHDYVTCIRVQHDRDTLVVTVHERTVCVAIYDSLDREIVTWTRLDVAASRSDDQTWRAIEPDVLVKAALERGRVVIRIRDGERTWSALKLPASLDIAIQPPTIE